MGIGYKLLREDLSSLSSEHGRVQYGPGWVKVPRDGAYIGLTLPGLLRGGLGEVLARVEYKSPTGAVDDGEVVTARRVRILQHAPVDVWAFVRAAIWGARQVLPPEGHPLREVALRALETAERCDKERTPEAGGESVWDLGMLEVCSVETAEEGSRWAAEGAKRAALWAVEWARRAADAAARVALRATEEGDEAEWVADAADQAGWWAAESADVAAWSASWASEASGAALARRLLDQFAKMVF